MKSNQINRSPWISAWSDPVAGVKSFSQLMCLADLKDDGDYKFIICDHMSKMLKVYMGTTVLYSQPLSNKPTAVVTFYESKAKPAIPVIAVAVQDEIYYY